MVRKWEIGKGMYFCGFIYVRELYGIECNIYYKIIIG